MSNFHNILFSRKVAKPQKHPPINTRAQVQQRRENIKTNYSIVLRETFPIGKAIHKQQVNKNYCLLLKLPLPLNHRFLTQNFIKFSQY
jgi:hypothetical protein